MHYCKSVISYILYNSKNEKILAAKVTGPHFFPLRLAAMRARDFAVSALPAPCGVLGTPNVGAAAGDANGLPGMPPGPGAKLKPPLGAGVAGAAAKDKRDQSI